MNEARIKKMNFTLKQIVGDVIYKNTYEIQNTFGIITVNNVSLAKDLSYLDVYVSSIKNSEILCKILKDFAREIKISINKELKLRKIPIVRFRYLDELEITSNLVSKINSLVN